MNSKDKQVLFDDEILIAEMSDSKQNGYSSEGESMSWKQQEAEALSSDGSATTASDGPKLKRREVWANKLDFLLACIGFSVGLGNVWRFPFLCYRNGGGAFLIPYFTAVFLGGIPVFFLEVSLGQYMSEGGIGTWKITPLFQGIGYACTIIVFLLNCEYNIILTWTFYYLFASFNSVLPWSHGDNDWNSELCRLATKNMTATNATSLISMVNNTLTTVAYSIANSTTTSEPIKCDPVTEFWERKVLQLSSGVDHAGTVKWDLALCLLLSWIVVYGCIWKGIKSSGKVMYFTATSPYLLMLILLIRGVTLDGAAEGLKFYLLPDWSKLAEPQVWVDAGTQIFFSYSISLGTLTALGSYNKFRHNSYRDTWIFAGVNSFTSILAGLVIFSVLGFMAKEQGVSVKDVAESGPGLAFIAYPTAVAQMPVAPLWSILFFIMIILLGLDSQFVGVEGFVTACVDMYPLYLRRGKRREIFTLIICIICFLIGLSMVTEGGMYVFQLFDYYSASRIVLVVAFFECIVVAYIYGINRYYDNLEMMFGFRISFVMKYAWLFVTPVFTLTIFIMGAISYSELTYKRKTVEYQYPSWAISVGWTLAMVSVVWIPIIFIKRVIDGKGSLAQRLMLTTRPILRRHQLRQGEDLSKIHLDESDFAVPGAPAVEDDCSRDEPLLANSVELQKLQNQQNGENNIEGEKVDSGWEGKILKIDELKNDACPICRLNVEIKYTDVLILQQFLNDKGGLLPRRATGVCQKSQKDLQTAVHKAQRAGLMPQFRPPPKEDRPRKYPVSNFKWKRFPAYYDN
ncbi:sodium- and chloride-dependent taurine transporter-like isoform X2 [Saccostrea echinata]|uniref:sodium- and chloride-dependent taurine transporter-like isoform X2 n=1 Tax=Saccostrea echinata TaxID=191078 RepID=UPI002A816309|nr:sodium- and chloride-dependent taurine transporter-like isoform X2 [Saccostrea echinata]